MRKILDQITSLVKAEKDIIDASGFSIDQIQTYVENGSAIVQIKQNQVLVHLANSKLTINKTLPMQLGRYHFIADKNKYIFDNQYDFIALVSGDDLNTQSQLTHDALDTLSLPSAMRAYYIALIQKYCPAPQLQENEVLRKIASKKYIHPQGSFLNLLHDFYANDDHVSMIITRSKDDHTTCRIIGKQNHDFWFKFDKDFVNNRFYPNVNQLHTIYLAHIQNQKNVSFRFDRQTGQFYNDKNNAVLALNDKNQISAFEVTDVSYAYDQAIQVAPFFAIDGETRYLGIDQLIKANMMQALGVSQSPFNHLKHVKITEHTIESLALKDELLEKCLSLSVMNNSIAQNNHELIMTSGLLRSKVKFDSEELAAIQILNQYIVQHMRHNNDFIYLTLPAVILFSAILTFHGLMTTAALMTTLTVVACLAALTLQIAILKINQSKLQNLIHEYKPNDYFKNPWIIYNGSFFTLAIVAYISLLSNPFLALLTFTSILSLSPVLACIFQRLRLDVIGHITTDTQYHYYGNVLPHVILPLAFVLSAMCAGGGIMAIPTFSTLMIGVSAVSALVLQFAIYQSKANAIQHNGFVAVLATGAYTLFMANPLAALIALTTVMTTAPAASVVYEGCVHTSLFKQPPQSGDISPEGTKTLASGV